MQRGAALAPRSGNAQNRGAGSGNRKKTAGNETQRKGNKRKQEESEQHGGSENEPPEKKLTSVSVKVPGKNVGKASSKKKLIAGQGKLTSFFRV